MVVDNEILPRWMKLKAAAHYSSIGEKRLIELAVSGAIKGFKDTDDKREPWVFDRLAIDKYREDQCSDIVNIKHEALAIINTL